MIRVVPKVCPHCGSPAVIPHCTRSRTCNWIVCPACRGYGTQNGSRWVTLKVEQ